MYCLNINRIILIGNGFDLTKNNVTNGIIIVLQ